MKAIIVTDFAYKGPVRKGRGTGAQGLRATLKYLQFRDTRNNHLAQNHAYERWHDHGLGQHYRAIFDTCDTLQSPHVLAWTWVISPAPELMALVPEDERRTLLHDLTERIVEDYYTTRGFEIAEYSYVVHERMTEPEEGETPQLHLHSHVILPGTAPLPGADRAAVYNNKEKGHDALFRELGTRHFRDALDQHVGPHWRVLREPPEPGPALYSDNLDDWFPR